MILSYPHPFSLKKTVARSPVKKARLQGANTFATSLSKEGEGTEEEETVTCINHQSLASSAMETVSERKEFASIKGLCFASLQHGHMSNDCKERKICRVCNRRHPTPFHGDLSKREEDNDKKLDLSKALTANSSASCFANRQGKSQTNSMIVPV